MKLKIREWTSHDISGDTHCSKIIFAHMLNTKLLLRTFRQIKQNPASIISIEHAFKLASHTLKPTLNILVIKPTI